MPVAGQRDPAQVKVVLEQWMASKMPEATDVEITDLVVPQSSGFSNETFLLDARWNEGGETVDARLVLRSQPELHHLFPEIDIIAQQYTVMRQLGLHTDVPVPTTRWAEPDPSVLGGTFFVMDRLDGLVPGDSPPYTQEGFVFDMDEATRRQWHTNAISALVSVGEVDWKAAGLEHLDRSHHGPLGPEQWKSYFQAYIDFALKGEEHCVIDPAWEWLKANWPDDGEFIELCWGDARPGNQMFDGTEVIGVFDWEMVSLGNSESDLGWWLFLQHYLTTGVGADLLPGMLDRDETIALWEQLKGRPASNVDFYERLAGFQFSLVMVRLATMYTMEHGADAVGPMATHNPVSLRTAELIGFEVPPPPTPMVRNHGG
jgi:aminoglycoside phosphotransferase (APT) family kinase protein